MLRPTIAFAGRRVDSPESNYSRFPLLAVPMVRARLERVFRGIDPLHLVCSASAGSDLLAISVAEELEIEVTIVLPTSVETFRKMSVIDRPGVWNDHYDIAIRRAKSRNLLTSYSQRPEAASYQFANEAIINQAILLAGTADRVIGVAAWDGHSRGQDDLTFSFLKTAKAMRIEIISVSTLP
jgi:hypothetical protein